MLSILVATLLAAHAQAPREAGELLRLASEPDTAAEALARGTRLAEDHPEDPAVFAFLVEALQEVGGPVLATQGPVERAWIAPEVRGLPRSTRGSGSRQPGVDGAVVVETPEGRRLFDLHTGEGFAPGRPVQPAIGEQSVAAGEGWRVEERGGACAVLDDEGTTKATLSPCADLEAARFDPHHLRVVTAHEPERAVLAAALWSVETGRRLADLGDDFNPAGDLEVRFSPAGDRMLVYNNTGGRPQYLWDPRTGERGPRLGPYPRDGRFTPDGSVLVLADVDLQAVDPDDGVVEHVLEVDGEAWEPRGFLRDGRHLAARVDGQAILWDVVDGDQATVTGPWEQLGSDGRRVLAGRPGGPVRIVDLIAPGAQAVYGPPLGSPAQALAVNNDSFVFTDGERMRAWHRGSATQGEERHVRWLAIHDGIAVASTGRAWTLGAGMQEGPGLYRYPEQIVPGPGIAYSWDPKAGPSSRFRPLVEPGEGVPVEGGVQLLASPEGHHFSADGSRFAAGFARGAGVWDTSAGRRLVRTGRSDPGSVALSSDGSRFAAAWGGTARVVDVDTGAELDVLELPGEIVFLALSPAGRHLLAGTDAGRVALLSVGSGDPATRLGGHLGTERLAFSADGERALVAGGGEVALWHVASRRRLARWESARASLARFAPSGESLAFVRRDWRGVRYPATAVGWQRIACRWMRSYQGPIDTTPACGRFAGERYR